MQVVKFKKEVDVDNYVRETLKNIGLELGKDFFDKNASDYLKNALKGASKTKIAKGKGTPDFTIECYNIPVIIECKLGLNKLEKTLNNTIDLTQGSTEKYALNGALHYANHLIKTNKYKEVIAIGVAGDNSENIASKILYVYNTNTYTESKSKNYSFLENEDSFNAFYDEIILSDEQKHKFLLQKRELITKHAKNLNKIMNDYSISTHERALYVAACLLAQQDITDKNGKVLVKGLKEDDLSGTENEKFRDSIKIKEHIEKFLQNKDLPEDKVALMISAFSRISTNALRDRPKEENHKFLKNILKDKASINKQVFVYIYENIFKEINVLNKNSKFYDVMGELYNEFLKYAMNDGKMGIVLTPSYVTKMMAKILNINETSRVMDLATGSAGFLISSMDLMMQCAKANPTKSIKEINQSIKELKATQLLGIEENTDMYALATTNMILRGDGSSQMIQNDSFDNALDSVLKEFKADRILLNPPFSYRENGMPFIQRGLDNMLPYSLGAIIIQDSAGSGKAEDTNKAILQKHTLLASIKMPTDLFEPMAGVQTSIYIFQAGIPHDFEKVVKFIDFRNDGYKRTNRNLAEIDNPIQRYEDILQIYKNGLNAKVKAQWNLKEIYIEDFISDKGNDWNFDQHKRIDTKPTLEDFKKCVSEYLAWEVSNVLKNNAKEDLRGKY
ncbi:N-6 DNA methylase [uncultured Campylobacter sp.]|uniref:HsdM family class I SAM-dependent methyltransferase n=1 Tax=uncultured Campylobacter sp. TaxID=218934 RepID=UPI00262D8A1C|nr:N-6 DNA methylase [uncultured Campylobacter sp.]